MLSIGYGYSLFNSIGIPTFAKLIAPNKIIKKTSGYFCVICVHYVSRRNKMSRMSEYQQRQEMAWQFLRLKYHITSFFHNNHLWHVGRQLAVVLLFTLHQNSVFGAIWQELSSLFTSVNAKRISKNAAFVFIFECFVLRQSLYENDSGRLTFCLSKYGMVGVSWYRICPIDTIIMQWEALRNAKCWRMNSVMWRNWANENHR